jgi:hypothetical protein
LKGGVELTWNISDNGDLELTNLTYNWTAQDFPSLNISTIELEGNMTLPDIPVSAKFIQISVANKQGFSPLSKIFFIECGYKGCEPKSSESLIIGVVSSVLVLSLIIFFIFFIQRCLFNQCFDF